MPALQEHPIQEDFSSGMFRDVAPHLIPADGAYDLANVFLNEEGSPYRRGGTVYKSNAAFGSAGLTFLADLYLKPGQRTVFANSSDFGVLDSNDATPVNLGSDGLSAPKQFASIQDLLFIGGGYIYGGSRMSANYTTGTVSLTNGSKVVTGSGTTWNTLVDAGMLFQRGNERAYVIESVDSTTQVTLRDAYQGVTGAGVAYTFYPIYKITAADPYVASDYYTVAGGRLLWADGNKVYFTNLDATTGASNPHTFTATDYHELPQGVQVVGLATIDQTVLIFTTAGVWTLSGITFDIVDANGNPQHRLELLSRDIVLFSAPGIASYQRSLILPALDGIYLMDSASAPQKISRPVDNLYVSYVRAGYTAGQAVVFNGHYLLPILAGSAVQDCLACRVDRPTRYRGRQTTFPWSRLTGDGGEQKAFAVRTLSGARTPVLLGAQSRADSRVETCTAFFAPSAATKNDGDGTTHQLDLISRDFETGAGTKNTVRSFRTRYELFDAASDDPILTASWGDGSYATGGYYYDTGLQYDTDLQYGTSEGASWTALACSFPESDGRDPRKCRINKSRRFIRLRLQGQGPAAACTIRSLQLDVRPSQAVRR